MAKMTRGEMQDLLGKFAMENSTYRDTLIKNPRAIVEKQFNMALAPNVKVKTVEETADTIYVIVRRSRPGPASSPTRISGRWRADRAAPRSRRTPSASPAP